MAPEPDTPIDADAEGVEPKLDRPRASTWLWKPLHAKLWWASSAVYWAGALASFWSPTIDEFYTSAVAGYLNLLFYPLTLPMVLGVGFIHAWMDFKGLEWGPPTDEHPSPKRSVGGFRDPMADRLDPRSPLHWQRYNRH